MAGFYHCHYVAVIPELYCRSQIPLLPKEICKNILFCLSHNWQKLAIAVCPSSMMVHVMNDPGC